MNKRAKREKDTLTAMLRIYCRDKHQADLELCTECGELFDYAYKRIDGCVLGNKKSTCAKCTIHCFKPEYRARIRKVMRYSGPRMIYKHPVLTIYHILDSRKK